MAGVRAHQSGLRASPSFVVASGAQRERRPAALFRSAARGVVIGAWYVLNDIASAMSVLRTSFSCIRHRTNVHEDLHVNRDGRTPLRLSGTAHDPVSMALLRNSAVYRFTPCARTEGRVACARQNSRRRSRSESGCSRSWHRRKGAPAKALRSTRARQISRRPKPFPAGRPGRCALLYRLRPPPPDNHDGKR